MDNKVKLTIQDKAALNWHIKELYKTTILDSKDHRLDQKYENFFKEKWEDLVANNKLDKDYLKDIVECYEKEIAKKER